MSTAVPVLPTDATAPTGLSHTLLAMSLTAIAVLRPLYEEQGGAIRDFAWVHLNPAGQQLLGQPECPTASLLTLLPAAQAAGVFAMCCRAFETGEQLRHHLPGPTEGGAGRWLVVAQRAEQLLVLRFTDPGEPLPPAGNHPLRARHDEHQRVTAALPATQQQLQPGSQALEAQVRARTQEAKHALAEAERQRLSLVELVQQAPAAMCIVEGPDFRYETFNPLYAAMFGGRPQLGRPMGEVLPEVVHHPSFQAFRAVYEEGRTFRQSEVLVPLARPGDGVLEDRYFSYTQQPRYGRQGQITGIFVFAVEVTEQVLARQQVEQLNQALEARVQERTQQMEAARAEAERQRGELERVFEQAPVAIAVYRGPTYTIELANPTVARLWGRTREQLLGKALFEALPEVAGMGYEALLDGVMATGIPYATHAMAAQHERNGQLETVYWDFVYVPVYAADGRINGAMVVANEVTAQVLARQQVEQLNQELEVRVAQRTQEAQVSRVMAELQRQRLEQLFLQAPASICILDGPDLVYELVNPAYQQLFPGRALAGLPLLVALPELRDQPVWHTLQQVYRTGQTHLELGIRIPVARTAGGPLEDFYFNYIQQARFNAQGQVDGAIVFAFDVTEQMLARQQVQRLNEELTVTNAELHESNRQLTRTNLELDTFIYTASHDLKTPITNVESIALALRSALPPAGQQDEVVAHLLDLLDQTTARFQATIGQLTDLSKLQLAHAGPAEPVPLAAVVESVRRDLAPLFTAAEAQFTVEVAPDLHVSFSPANLRSIVYNLLSNALKYRAPDRPAQVAVRATRTEQRVVLEVQDNGLGLSAHQQSRLFGLFQRLHTHVEGTGVGLYITKRLVENGGGTIAVASQVDVGTTFTLTLPA